MTNNYKTLIVDIRDKILRIALNRPEKRNALNEQMVEELTQIFNAHTENKNIDVVTVTGKGTSFCAGADLEYLHALAYKSYEENLRDSEQIKEMYWSIFSFPKPTIAIVNGPAVAGGCGLVNVCDLAIASDNASFGYPEVKIGFVASIVSVFLIQTVGYRRCLELLLTGKIIDADTARRLGLVHKITKTEDLYSDAEKLVEDLKKNSPEAVKLSKQLLQRYIMNDLKMRLDETCVFNARSRQNPDFKEGLLSFLEKRSAYWQK